MFKSHSLLFVGACADATKTLLRQGSVCTMTQNLDQVRNCSQESLPYVLQP
jgi:hypothetical protein